MIIATGSQSIRFVTSSQCSARWDDFVRCHPKGSVFHLSGMVRSFEEAKNHEPFAYAAENAMGEIVAIVCGVRLITLGGFLSNMDSRFVCYAEPLCDDSEEGKQGLRKLLEKLDQHMAGTVLYSEVRPMHAPGSEKPVLSDCGYHCDPYLNYVVDTRLDAEELWMRLGKSTRNKIRKSRRRGVEVVLDQSAEAIDRVYPLLQESYRRSRIPMADISLFHAAHQYLGEQLQVRVATFEGRDVVAGIGLVYGDRFYAWYGGGSRVKGVVPFDCLTWDEIAWSSNNGLQHYDFGGAGWPDEAYGPRDFKAKFRGELVEFGRYQRVYSPTKLRFAETAFNTLRTVRSWQQRLTKKT